MKLLKGQIAIARLAAFALVFLLIMCVIIVPIYSLAMKTANEALSGEITSYFKQGLTGIEANLKSLDNLCYTLRNNISVIRASLVDDAALSAVNDMYVYYLMRDTRITQNLNDYYEGIFMMFEHNNLMYIGDCVYNSGQTAFDNKLITAGGLSYAEFRAMHFDDEASWRHIGKASVQGRIARDNLLYINRFGIIGGNGIIISFLLSVESLKHSLILPSLDNALLSVELLNGDTLYSDAGDAEADYRLWSEAIPNYGLRLNVYVPQQAFRDYIRTLAQTLETLMALALTVITASTVFLIWYVLKPLMPVLQLISGEDGLANAQKNLFKRIAYASERQMQLARSREIEYNAVLRQMISAALTHALRGERLSAEETKVLSELPVLQDEYTVVIFRFASVTDENIQNLQAYGYICFGQTWNESAVFDGGEFTGVVSAKAFIKAEAQKVRAQLEKMCTGSIAVGWSYAHTGIEALYEATVEARAFLKTKLVSKAPAEKPFNKYEQYDQFALMLEAGDSRALDIMDSAISMAGALDQAELRAQVAALSHIVAKHTLEPAARFMEQGEAALIWLRRKVEGIMELAYANSAQSRGGVSDDIIAYIDENLGDTELSLASLSDKFNLSANYISMLIRNQTGRSYSVYLTDQRMRLALELLKGTDMSIDEIALKAGYFHKNTFYKVFKRTFSQPPNYYRQNPRA